MLALIALAPLLFIQIIQLKSINLKFLLNIVVKAWAKQNS